MNGPRIWIYFAVFLIGLMLMSIARGFAGVKVGFILFGIAILYIFTGKFLGETAQWIFVILFVAFALMKCLWERGGRDGRKPDDPNDAETPT